MKAFDIEALRAELPDDPDVVYREFLRVPAMSGGLYRLEPGAIDPQEPHSEDEIYYVLSGQAAITVSGEGRPVGPGDLIYVPAHAPHSFHEITEALTLLVIFAPAETAG